MNEAMEHNPFLEQENYFEKYTKNIEQLKNDPRMIEFDKLTYEVFEMNPQGKRFLELAKDKFLLPALVQRGSPTYQLDLMWADGFKDFIRMVMMNILAHKQRMQAEMK